MLVVDDDQAILAALDRALRAEGFRTVLASTGSGALRSLPAALPDVMVLDLGLPERDGIDVITDIRAKGSDVPICVLSARTDVSDRVAALQAGADDFVVKPFAVRELIARLHALLRRRPDSVVPLQVGDLTVDPARMLVHRGERTIELTRREFELLWTLARHTGIVLTRELLLAEVWGYDFTIESNVVDVFISYLRRKLEEGGEPRLIQTVRGVGFVLRTP